MIDNKTETVAALEGVNEGIVATRSYGVAIQQV